MVKVDRVIGPVEPGTFTVNSSLKERKYVEKDLILKGETQLTIARIHNQLPLSAKWFNNQRLHLTRVPESWREEGQRNRDLIEVRGFHQQKSGRRGIRTPG